jgi:archaeosine synthase beta-subunit
VRRLDAAFIFSNLPTLTPRVSEEKQKRLRRIQSGVEPPHSKMIDADILAARPPKQRLDPWKPYAYFVEPERMASGRVEDMATIFLTNKECPFRCTMCDLWKYTLDERVPVGAIPAQIDHALERLPPAKHVKLYNAGNFFDAQAIPPEDHEAIAARVRRFETVIVENHPRLTDDRCVKFRDLLWGRFPTCPPLLSPPSNAETQARCQPAPRLEVALGLETIHPDILPRLNKRMTVEDFDRSSTFLREHDIDVRAFLLLKPAGLNDRDGIEWAVKSMEHAFDVGVGCCSVIPTRAGNGFMDRLQTSGEFVPPTIRGMEEVLARGIELARGRVFIDLWDAEKFCDCTQCGPARIERLRRMNLAQQIESNVVCSCGIEAEENPLTLTLSPQSWGEGTGTL